MEGYSLHEQLQNCLQNASSAIGRPSFILSNADCVKHEHILKLYVTMNVCKWGGGGALPLR
jgi:hypothetical protein